MLNSEQQIKKFSIDVGSEKIFEELLTHSLGEVTLISQNLKNEESSLRKQVKQLAATNYATFLTKVNISSTVLQDFSDLKNLTEDFSKTVPLLSSDIDEIEVFTQSTYDKSQDFASALTKHNQLSELLELPQIMDACIQNGYYDDALEILDFSSKLDKSFEAKFPLINAMVRQINENGGLLLMQMCKELSSASTIPECLKIIVYLRRMGCINELTLRLIFLRCKSKHLNNTLVKEMQCCPQKSFTGGTKEITENKQMPGISAIEKLCRKIELTRIHLFEIISQYKAIFNDDGMLSTDRLSGAAGNAMTMNPLIVESNDAKMKLNKGDSHSIVMGYHTGTPGNSYLLFASWLNFHLDTFIEQLFKDLNSILERVFPSFHKCSLDRIRNATNGIKHLSDLNSSPGECAAIFCALSSLLTQLQHFGKTFARVGSDLRPRFAQKMIDLLHQLTVYMVGEVHQNFIYALENFSWLVQDKKAFSSTNNSKTESHDANSDLDGDIDEVGAPSQVLQHSPLVVLWNDLSGLFNGLLKCFPLHSRNKLLRWFLLLLSSCSENITGVYQKKLDLNLLSFREEASQMVKVYVNSFLPSILDSFLQHLLEINPTNYSYLVKEALFFQIDLCSDYEDYHNKLVLDCCLTLEKHWPQWRSFITRPKKRDLCEDSDDQPVEPNSEAVS